MTRAQHSIFSNLMCFMAYVMLIIMSSTSTPAIATPYEQHETTPLMKTDVKNCWQTWGCFAGVTAVASFDLIVTAMTLYVTFHCDTKQQSEPCKTWQSIVPATALTAIVTTAGSLGCFAARRLLASTENSNSCELQTVKVLQHAYHTN